MVGSKSGGMNGDADVDAERMHLLPGCSRVLRGVLTCATVSCYLPPPPKNAWLNKQRHARLPCWWGVHLTWLVPWKYRCALHLTVLQDSSRYCLQMYLICLKSAGIRVQPNTGKPLLSRFFTQGLRLFKICGEVNGKFEKSDLFMYSYQNTNMKANYFELRVWGGNIQRKKTQRFPIYLHRVITSTIIFT